MSNSSIYMHHVRRIDVMPIRFLGAFGDPQYKAYTQSVRFELSDGSACEFDAFFDREVCKRLEAEENARNAREADHEALLAALAAKGGA